MKKPSKHWPVGRLIGILLMVATVPTQASMRCGTELIESGDSALKLLEACGTPSSGDPRELDYSEWTYNFGPTEFMMKVTIIDGKAERFDTLGRGFYEEEDAERALPPPAVGK